VYLNITRHSRSDVWLDAIFCEASPEEVYLRQAVVDMGCVAESLVLFARHLDPTLYVTAGPKAGDILRPAGGLGPLQRLLGLDPVGRGLVGRLRLYWDLRNDCEHGKPPPSHTDIIDLLNKCVSMVILYQAKVSGMRPW